MAVDEAEQVQDGNGVTILDLFNAVRKHVITAVVTLVIVMVAICAYTFTRTPQYTATSELLATYRSSAAASGASSNASELSSGANYINSQIQTYPQLVKTESVLQPVIDDLGLDTTVKELAESVTASNPDGTMLVDISVNDPDPKQGVQHCQFGCRKPGENRLLPRFTAMRAIRSSLRQPNCGAAGVRSGFPQFT